MLSILCNPRANFCLRVLSSEKTKYSPNTQAIPGIGLRKSTSIRHQIDVSPYQFENAIPGQGGT